MSRLLPATHTRYSLRRLANAQAKLAALRQKRDTLARRIREQVMLVSTLNRKYLSKEQDRRRKQREFRAARRRKALLPRIVVLQNNGMRPGEIARTLEITVPEVKQTIKDAIFHAFQGVINLVHGPLSDRERGALWSFLEEQPLLSLRALPEILQDSTIQSILKINRLTGSAINMRQMRSTHAVREAGKPS